MNKLVSVSWEGEAPQANFLQSSFSFIPAPDRVRSHFRGAKLRGAKLRGAKLQGAKYVGAKLQGVKYQNAKLSLFWCQIIAQFLVNS